MRHSHAREVVVVMAIVASWRICEAFDGRGLMMYFDPFLETPAVRPLTGPERARRLAESVSVSALVEVEEDGTYDPTYIELNGVDPYDQKELF